MSAITILGVLSALAATVLAFLFIVPEKKRAKLNKFGKFLHDTVNFKFLIVEKVLQALYIFATALTIFIGFFLLFYVQRSYYWDSSTWYGGYGLLLILVGPIAVRLAYEFIMMAILLVKNVIQINGKLKNENEEEAVEIFKVPTFEKSEEPEVSFCSNCGTKVAGGAFCKNCGNKI